MLGVEVLRAVELRSEDVGSDFVRIPSSDDSVSNNSDGDANKSSFISELITNEGDSNNTSQTEYIAKMKSKCTTSHDQKPYDQLSEREKQRLMERQSRRVLRMREEMRRYGINRSISHDLGKNNDNNAVGHRRRENSTCSVGSLDSCDDLSSSFEDEEDLERNLESWYQSGCWEEDANDRSSRDLVKNYMDMEDRIEQLQKSLMEARLQQGGATRRTFNVEAELEKIRVFREEIETLVRENDVLQAENEKLRMRLPSKTG